MKKNNQTKTLVLFDAHAILHRAYHALPDFTSTSGEPTGALYGLAAMLIRIIAELKPDYMAACYDLPEPTFRKQVYEAYKAGRAKTDDALVAQMDRSREIFTAFNIPIYDKPGFEADDIIGTIVAETKNKPDLRVIIASGDMDTLQLVSDDKVLVFTLKKGINDTVLYNEVLVKERFGFGPTFLPDYKGLRGDPSDNIIGIVGIGEKIATTLISTFGSIENIYKKLKQSDEPFLQAGLKPRTLELLRKFEEEALFSKALATIRLDAPINFSLPQKEWVNTFNFGEVEKLFQQLDFKSLLSRVKTAFAHTDSVRADNQVVKKQSINNPLDEKLVKKLAIALWLINSEKTNPTPEDILSYCQTSDWLQAEKFLQKKLSDQNLVKLYEDIELPIIDLLSEAERWGIVVDVKYLKTLSIEYHKKLNLLEQEIWALVGHEFNINSPKQLGTILFDELNLTAKGLKKTAGGARSTKESELVKIKDLHPVIGKILDYRELQKLLSTYIDTIPTMIGEDGRLHAKLHQTGTTTGRMSSSDPNMQNIPVREGFGEKIRRAFVASPGYVWVGADYSQIEMRILALLSGDRSLINIFKEGKDVHGAVASLVFKVSETEVTKEMRRKAKVINFGIIYGMGVNALRSNLGSTREEAQQFYDEYFATFPTIKNYFDEVIHKANTQGYTETYFGRRRYFPGLKSKLPYLRASAERMAMNAPIQGTATGDITKIAMNKVQQLLDQAGLAKSAHLLLQVHDELIYEVRVDNLNEITPLIKKGMEEALVSEVPLVVNIATGPDWGSLSK
ncbi:MAG: hypothetical protein K8Q91_00515 [Candidatus Vogelbacteria bacterium]|nr:hypothetical protein [Candidatus Vogelbacteria bacterium]